ncbi:MAG: alpha/beta hydrolase [Firmicutes bacterium]|nr:alpha/beta hydrolase [Bacillota bacterium]
MKTGVLQVTDDPDVTLTYYVHDLSNELPNCSFRPAMLVLPGGGYRMCSDREAEPIALAYMAEGFNAFVLRYSLREKAAFPKPLNDAEKALQMILDRAKEWSVDTRKTAAVGFSAGGHLAAALGTMGKVKPAALILCYAATLDSISAIMPAPVPSLDGLVDETTPPTFLFSTSADRTVPIENTLAFARALDRAKVPFEAHIFQNDTHGISLAKPLTSIGLSNLADPVVAQWFKMSVDWLHMVLGDFDCSKTSL